jgi:hypothetical protein
MTFLSEHRADDERRHPQGRELFDTTSGIVAEHLWSKMTPEYPGLTLGRTVKCLCDPCGTFRTGHLAPGAR